MPCRPLLPLLAVLLLLCAACTRVEGTGRSQLNFYPDATLNQMGVEAYAEVAASEKPCPDPAVNALVERVGRWRPSRASATSSAPSRTTR